MKRKNITNRHADKINPIWQQIIAFGIAVVEQNKQQERQNAAPVFQVMP